MSVWETLRNSLFQQGAHNHLERWLSHAAWWHHVSAGPECGWWKHRHVYHRVSVMWWTQSCMSVPHQNWTLSPSIRHEFSTFYSSSFTKSNSLSFAPPLICLLLTLSPFCVIFLQGCRKWTPWLTKDWKMSSSQTSGAKSAWRDSAPLVMCWSVMIFCWTYISTHLQ